MTLFKKMDRAGRISIPSLLRNSMGFSAGTAVEITEMDNCKLLIEKQIPTCRCCGETESLIKYKGLELCRACLQEFERRLPHGDK